MLGIAMPRSSPASGGVVFVEVKNEPRGGSLAAGEGGGRTKASLIDGRAFVQSAWMVVLNSGDAVDFVRSAGGITSVSKGGMTLTLFLVELLVVFFDLD